MSIETLQAAFKKRRTIYNLNKQLPISQAEVKSIIEQVILHTPSAFNSQSTRALVLFDQSHEKLWDITADVLREIVGDAEKFTATAAKLNGFKAAAGTVLFFEDQSIVRNLQSNIAAFADKFPTWSEQGGAMNQYALWTAFSEANIGANLQHYNPVIDQKVQDQWDIPADWKLTSQLVFGGINEPAGEKAFEPLENRIKYAS